MQALRLVVFLLRFLEISVTHNPIHLDHLSFILPHKTCFHEPKVVLRPGQRIALIGANGSGKSTLLSMLFATASVNMRVGLVPQLHEDDGKSGAEQFHQRFSVALSDEPVLLLLDEPTNHLDRDRRLSFKRMLKGFRRTLVVATHDEDLLRTNFDGLWHLHDGSLRAFYGNYDDYCALRAHEHYALVAELASVKNVKRQAHSSLMREQARAKKSRHKGEKSIRERKWPTIVSTAKATRAEETTGRKKAALREKRADLIERLEQLRLPEVIAPNFHFASSHNTGVVLMVRSGSCGYDTPLIHNINCTVRFGERLALVGNNAAGKSTLMKAIMGHDSITRDGLWQTPALVDIGYLDQNYRNLRSEWSVLQTIGERRPEWTMAEIRRHLNAFLFRKNEEVSALVSELSGGERARLSLCAIAAKSPRLLLLDEITNNVDRETRVHIIETLSAYLGSMVFISHDDEFHRAMRADVVGTIADGHFTSS